MESCRWRESNPLTSCLPQTVGEGLEGTPPTHLHLPRFRHRAGCRRTFTALYFARHSCILCLERYSRYVVRSTGWSLRWDTSPPRHRRARWLAAQFGLPPRGAVVPLSWCQYVNELFFVPPGGIEPPLIASRSSQVIEVSIRGCLSCLRDGRLPITGFQRHVEVYFLPSPVYSLHAGSMGRSVGLLVEIVQQFIVCPSTAARRRSVHDL